MEKRGTAGGYPGLDGPGNRLCARFSTRSQVWAEPLPIMAYAQWLSLLAAIADAADVIAMHYFRSHALEVQEKRDASPVTGADLEIEQGARRIAGERCPELGVCGEEYGETQGSADAGCHGKAKKANLPTPSR